jgi:hypothetical protein
VLAVAVIVAVGCDSSQPDRIDTRTASVSFKTTAESFLFDCYEVWIDQSNPPDGIPEFNAGVTTCDETTQFQERAVPWNYALGISIIRAGTTTEETVTSLTGLPGSSVLPGDDTDVIADFISLTDFDPTIGTAAPKPHQDEFYFLNGKQVSRGSPYFLSAFGFSVGTPNILDTPLTVAPTFDFSVNTGDTIIVRARKQSLAAAPPYLPPVPDPKIILEATLAVGGVSVVPTGSSVSTVDDQSGFTLSFTVP